MIADPVAAVLSITLTAVLSVTLLLLLARRDGVVTIAMVAFALRVLRGLDVQNSGFVSDAGTYDGLGVLKALYWQGLGTAAGDNVGKDGWPTILASIYFVVGHVPQVGYLVNAFAGGLTVIVVASVTRQMGWHPAVRPAAWIVAIWPVAFLWGGMLLREAIVTLLLAIGLWGAVHVYKRHFVSGSVVILISGMAMIPMRGGLAFLILVGMPLTAAAAVNLHLKLRPSTVVFAVLAGVATFVLLSTLSQHFDGSRYFEYRSEVSVEQNTGNSSFAMAGLGDGAVNQSLAGHAYRVPLTAFGPYPWQVSNVSLLLAAIDALLWLGVWALCIYATVRLKKRYEAMLFILPAVALIVYLAANSSNFGLIIRLRGLGIALVAPLAALGWVVWRQHRRGTAMRKRQAREALMPTRARQLRAAATNARRSTVVDEREAELVELLR